MKNLKIKSYIPYLLLVAILFILPSTSTAQLLKGLGKKIEQKIERETNKRVERQVDRAIDKGMDKVEQTAEEAVKGGTQGRSEQSSDPTNASIPGFPMSSDNDVSISERYDFTLGVTYNVRDDEQKKPTEMTMWFGGDDYIGMSVPMQKDVFMIMHGANMVTFMQKDKKYMVLGSGITAGILGAAAAEAEEDEDVEFSINKIGTERILNYNCTIYEAKSSEYVTKLWLTEELGIDAGHFMASFSTLVKSAGKFPNVGNNAGGLLLKMEGKSTQDKGAMIMEATAIDKNGLQFNTTGYSNFGF